jgi:hypothetical protein
VVKLLWLAICTIEDKRAREREEQRGRPPNQRTAQSRLIEGQVTTNWKQALGQLAIAYPDRATTYTVAATPATVAATPAAATLIATLLTRFAAALLISGVPSKGLGGNLSRRVGAVEKHRCVIVRT